MCDIWVRSLSSLNLHPVFAHLPVKGSVHLRKAKFRILDGDCGF